MNDEDEPVSNGIIFTSTRAVPARVVEEEEEPQGSAAIDERTERARGGVQHGARDYRLRA